MLIAYLVTLFILVIGFVVFGYISTVKDLPSEHILVKMTVICMIAFSVLLTIGLGYGIYRLIQSLFTKIF